MTENDVKDFDLIKHFYKKIQINQMKNVYLSNQNYRCRNLDSSDIKAYAWEYNKERKKF